ncbi:MAG: ribonuclease HI family protein [Candidatus Woesebacteria bacterium]|jgi:ribonuclease HI
MSKGGLQIYCDGGARGNPGPAASAFVVEKAGERVFKDSKFLGENTNNFAEYTAVIMALEWLVQSRDKIKEDEVEFFLDSQLVASQLSGRYKIKSKTLKPLAIKVKEMERESGKKIKYNFVRRKNNKVSDALVNDVLDENLQ